MQLNEYIQFIVGEIHTTVVATIDKNGFPVTCAIDIMDGDETGLYFLTAKGKGFYDRLVNNQNIAFTGMKGKATMSCIAVSIRGKAKEIGNGKIPQLFEKNPYMFDIYPSEESRMSLTVFHIFEASGEWFDLSKIPIERSNFTWGNVEEMKEGYYVTDTCTACMSCHRKCPQKCIDISLKPVVIKQAQCLHCGNCFAICPQKAVIKR